MQRDSGLSQPMMVKKESSMLTTALATSEASSMIKFTCLGMVSQQIPNSTAFRGGGGGGGGGALLESKWGQAVVGCWASEPAERSQTSNVSRWHY